MIKTTFISILSVMLSMISMAQADSIPQIMDRGIALHEEGKYELSLIEYRKALDLEPKNAFVNYEMALSYYFMNKKDKAEEHAKIASQEESETGVQGVILLGTLYDEQGKTKKSIKVYESALKRFGDYYLIWFNLGVTYNGMNELVKAADAFAMAANNRLDYSSSHYGLATMKQLQGKRAEALLPMYFFLLLEPDSERSPKAVASINDIWKQDVSEKSETEITFNLAPTTGSDPMNASELFISMLEASKNLEENEGKSDFELHQEKAEKLFSFMAELDLEKRDDYYTQYYIPFFSRIGESEHIEAFLHYALQSGSRDSREWVVAHADELDAFFTWLDENDSQ